MGYFSEKDIVLTNLATEILSKYRPDIFDGKYKYSSSLLLDTINDLKGLIISYETEE